MARSAHPSVFAEGEHPPGTLSELPAEMLDGVLAADAGLGLGHGVLSGRRDRRAALCAHAILTVVWSVEHS
jgi:hypothetical protein